MTDAPRWEGAYYRGIMRPAVDRMTTALRVLAAVVEGRIPDSVDVDDLRHLAPRLSGAPVDELACSVIQEALDRAEERRAAERGRRRDEELRPIPWNGMMRGN